MVEPSIPVTFVEASPDQRARAWRLNGQSWAYPISVPSYISRETLLHQTDLSRPSSPLGGCKYFVLHLQSDPHEIVASLEVTTKAVVIADRHGIKNTKGHAIASVYTQPKYRGVGMATYLLAKTKEFMDQQEMGECSALYSDIGTSFYARQGWKVFPSLQAALVLSKEETADSRCVEGVRYLQHGEIQGLCAKDVEGIRNHFSSLFKAGTHGRDKGTMLHVTFLPTWEQVSWHFTRDAYMARELYDRAIQHRGAITSDEHAWIYWDHDFRENKLKIIRLVLHNVQNEAHKVKHAALLLRMAVEEAADWELGKVLVWNPDSIVSEAIRDLAAAADGNSSTHHALKAVFDERLDGSIPSLRWKGDRMPETAWLFNEYVSWC